MSLLVTIVMTMTTRTQKNLQIDVMKGEYNEAFQQRSNNDITGEFRV